MEFTSLGVPEHLIAALAKRGITAPHPCGEHGCKL